MLFISLQPVKLEIGEELHLSIRFNPAHEEDLNIRVVEKALTIQFLEHPHEEQVTIRGEVYFPNLHIETMALDFGCILNDTEDVRYVEMTNCSPLLVQYCWSFLTESHMSQMRYVHLCPLLEALSLLVSWLYFVEIKVVVSLLSAKLLSTFLCGNNTC